MKNTLKTIGYISIIPLLVGLYFFENIKGYVQFKQYCAAHPQFIINEKLEPNVGWQSDLENAPESKDIISERVYFIPQIRFYRFRDYHERQSVLDVRFVGSARISSADYENIPYNPDVKKPANESSNFSFEHVNYNEKTIYQHEQFGPYNIPNQIRLETMGYRVLDLRTKKTIVESSYIVYRIFDKEIYSYNAICGDTLKLWNELERSNNNQLFKGN